MYLVGLYIYYRKCCRKHSRNSTEWETTVARPFHADVSVISCDAQFKQGMRNQQVFVLYWYFYFLYTESNVCLFVCLSICFPGNFHVNAYVCVLTLREVVDKLLSLATTPHHHLQPLTNRSSNDVVCVQKLLKTPHYFPNYPHFCTPNRRSSNSKYEHYL